MTQTNDPQSCDDTEHSACPQQLSLWQDLQERVSGWMDGERDENAHELLNTQETQRVWQDWHLIGDVLRSPQLAIAPSGNFYVRLSAALDQAPQEAAIQPVQTPAAQIRPAAASAVARPVNTAKRPQRLAWLSDLKRFGRNWSSTKWSHNPWGWSGGFALAAALAVWLLLPHLSSDESEDTHTIIATAGELNGNPYVQAHRQFAGSNPIGQISLDMGVKH